jgi:hypothetical protein
LKNIVKLRKPLSGFVNLDKCLAAVLAIFAYIKLKKNALNG